MDISRFCKSLFQAVLCMITSPEVYGSHHTDSTQPSRLPPFVELLQRVLNRKLTISQQAEKQQLVDKFWQSVTSLLARQLSHEAHNSLFVKQALEGEYPKFLRLYLDLCKRLQALSNQSNGQLEVKMIISTDSTTAETSVFQINREVVVEFENAYLSRSVSRLLDPVHLMFSGETVPSHEEVDSLIRTITSELSVSLVDVSLSRTVARNISKTVRLFCLKCEQMIVTSGEATQVIDSPTPGQILNVSIGNLLHYLNCQVVRVISNMKTSLQQDTSSIVMESLSNTELLTTSIVSTLLASILDGIEAIILTMHNEDYSMISTSGDKSANLDPKRIDVSCSLYMKELQSFVSRAVSSYLAPFHNQEIISKW
uniref:Conserved oligomeric Golgi complex subunit 5 helical domain-containing protein n=1 Tax=Timema monikensis TaxID=170555 RepID=A0A7R9HU02_9NEOP|nr:unnamed protein product [Timema monikensis]